MKNHTKDRAAQAGVVAGFSQGGQSTSAKQAAQGSELSAGQRAAYGHFTRANGFSMEAALRRAEARLKNARAA